ncbi:MAG: hypothetical protein HQL94_00905 [Magnetococcales bacterium]|nr:hypothetical protein [Magnetococcales bacterium]MBF0437970.1 hypothetical protein [Magnetococcales bacterium]
MNPTNGLRGLNEIKGTDVRSYAASRQETGIKPSTINRELNTLSTAFNWARRNLGWEVVNPVEEVQDALATLDGSTTKK